MKKTTEVDLAVIGGGIAGLSAGLYGARAGVATLILEKKALGGQLLEIEKLSNFPGIPAIAGAELAGNLRAQAEDAGAEIEPAEVTGVETVKKGFILHTDVGSVRAGAVVIATGAKPRELGLEQERELVGHGVSYCAVCDGALCTGKTVAVVGGGNSAFNEALTLAEVCAKVLVLYRGERPRAEAVALREAKKNPKIEVIFNAEVVELVASAGKLTGVKIAVGGAEPEPLALSALFVAIGRVPDAEIFDMVERDENGYIMTDASGATNVPGIFAAGDVTAKPLRQAVTAASAGAVSAMSVVAFLRER